MAKSGVSALSVTLLNIWASEVPDNFYLHSWPFALSNYFSLLPFLLVLSFGKSTETRKIYFRKSFLDKL